ncbi:lysozyme inhibitor LprI family protein [Massilia sp.]|uniref:lysozyme inhibitor LprI family protein n=1 Tax=Massilia sp. TaxID=1882437 RepID=UPI0028AD0779|nr:lysozyme inhibitor LprI family protein [Massilia sp.]
MRRHLSCLLLAALAAGSVHAAGPNAPEAECAALGKLAYPAADRPSAAQQVALSTCDAPALYYGIRQPRDFVKARHCAFTPDKDDDVFSKKAGVLMMLYANGQGVARNLQLAKKAACAAGGAPAELSGRLTHLNDMAPGKSAAGQTIDFCEDVTSGMMMGYCASLGAAQDDVKREGALAAIAATFKPNERAAFSHLLNSLSRFVEARGGNEVDLSGTARGAMVVEEEDAQKDAFLAALQAFERGKLPRFSAAQDQAIDRELNTVYGQLRRLPAQEYTTIKMADIQATQRIWLVYRDAWVEFGKLRYPAVPAHAWRAYFTQQRTAMLKALLEELS